MQTLSRERIRGNHQTSRMSLAKPARHFQPAAAQVEKLLVGCDVHRRRLEHLGNLGHVAEAVPQKTDEEGTVYCGGEAVVVPWRQPERLRLGPAADQFTLLEA